MAVFETQKLLNLISRKFRVTVNALHFHTEDSFTEIYVKSRFSQSGNWFHELFSMPCYDKCMLFIQCFAQDFFKSFSTIFFRFFHVFWETLFAELGEALLS